MARTRTWSFSNELKRNRKYVQTDYDGMIESAHGDITTREGLATMEDWAITHMACMQLGSWRGLKGVVTLADNLEEGWSIVNESCQWHLLSQQIYDAFRARPVRPRASRTITALLLAHGLAVHDDSMVNWSGELLLGSVSNPDWFWHPWNLNYLPWFMTRLYAKLIGSTALENTPRLCKASIYDKVLDSWADEKAFAAAVHSACDFHIVREADPNFPDFYCDPFSFYPVEILALARVRKALGEPMPAIAHPLMETPLASPPVPLPSFDEPVMQSIRQRLDAFEWRGQ